MIEDTKTYVLLPVYDEEMPLNARGFLGKNLKELYSEEVLINALEHGEKIVYKGNEYFLDEKL